MALVWDDLPQSIKGGALESVVAQRLVGCAIQDDSGLAEIEFKQEREGLAVLLAREIISNLPLIQEPMSLLEFTHAREEYLQQACASYFKRCDRAEKNLHIPWWYSELWQDYLRLSLLDAGGLLMKSEFHTTVAHVEGELVNDRSKKKREKALSDISNQLFRTRISDRTPKDKKIANVQDAVELIDGERISGNRVMVVFGGFDGTMGGHMDLFNSVSEAIGVNGRLFVFVSSDKELQLTKGSGRPLYPLETRLIGVSSSAAVDHVCPIFLPEGVDNPDSLIRYYADLHSLIHPHFRVLGEKDARFEHFRSQCEPAGVGLLVHDKARITSTTGLIKKLTELPIT